MTTWSPRELKQLNKKFEQAAPSEIIRWAVETFRPDVAVTSSFGTDSAALLHLACQVDPSIAVRFVDTGFHFPETMRHLELVEQQLRLQVEVFRTALSETEIALLKAQHATQPIDDQYCCCRYKVEATRRALQGLRCWITGITRAEAITRRHTPIVDVLNTGMVKVAPLATWTAKQTHAYMQIHGLPYHPLWAAGYTSIGCALHTQRPLDPNDPRSGRWAGQDKTECGIHDIGKPKPPTT